LPHCECQDLTKGDLGLANKGTEQTKSTNSVFLCWL